MSTGESWWSILHPFRLLDPEKIVLDLLESASLNLLPWQLNGIPAHLFKPQQYS